MLSGRRIVVVMPAYNAAGTLERTLAELPAGLADEVILVDDASADATAALARRLGLTVFTHAKNLGYGANQKTCYALALRAGADVVVMLHPDYQYPPRAMPALVSMVVDGGFDICLGSRVLGRGARAGGMPLWRYIGNRLLTAVQNVALGQRLSEYHTGYRAFSRRALLSLPIESNSDDFVFDNQVLVEARHYGLSVGEVSAAARYFPGASSIGFLRSCAYGAGVLAVTLRYILHRSGLVRSRLFALEAGGAGFLAAREARLAALADRFGAPAT